MGLFDRFKKNKNQPSAAPDTPSGQPPVPPEAPEITPDFQDPEFEAAFKEATSRYISSPGGGLEADFKDHDGNPISITYAFAGTREEWLGIQSVWDKRAVIWAGLDDLFLNRLDLWQAIERFTLDRRPHHALELAKKHATEAMNGDANYAIAMSRCCFVLGKYGEGAQLAKNALKIEPENRKAKVLLADNYHLGGNHEEAHALWQEALEDSELKKMSESLGPDEETIEINLMDIVGFHGKGIYSSVYAVSLLQSAGTDAATWDWIAGEYYWCPYFRSQHAFYLVNQGENLKGMAKLVSLSDEMPWFQDGVVNAYGMIVQMEVQNMFPEDLNRLKRIMKEKGWESPFG